MAFIDVNGVRLFWHEAGAEHRGTPGHTIVFVHGFQGNAGVWRRQFETLTDRYHTVVLNNRGRAPSDAPAGVENYTLDHFAADLDAFIEAQEYDQLTLVGWSMGVSTCLNYLRNHRQDRLQALILVDGSPSFRKFPRPQPHPAEQEAPAREVAPPGESPEVWGERFGPITDDCRQGSLKAIDEADFLPFLIDVTVPTEVLHGHNDPLVPYAAGEALADGIPSARLRNFTVSGHAPMWDEPGRFDREIGHFIARVTAEIDPDKFENRALNQRYQRQ